MFKVNPTNNINSDIKDKVYKKPELRIFGKLMELTKGSLPGDPETGMETACGPSVPGGCL